jgi:nicotinamide mononucleotide transporter
MLEFVAAGFTLANVYFATRQNMWTWPLGVVAVSLYLYVFAVAKLYSDAGLQIFFLAMQFYGWYHWARGGVADARSLGAVTRLSRRGWTWTTAGVIAWTASLGTLLHHYTDAAAPYPDSFTTILSVIAQFQMTRKILDNWTLWIVADVVYIVVYSYKALYWTAGLYVVFLALCIQGYREWKNDLQ